MLLEGKRVTINDPSIYFGAIGTVRSHAEGLVAVEIEKGVGRGRTITVMDMLVAPVSTFDGATIKEDASCASSSA